MSSSCGPRVFRLDVCRICGFEADGDDQSENGDYCSVCGFCLLRPVAPKRAPPPAPTDAAAAKSAVADSVPPLSSAPSPTPPAPISSAKVPPPPKRPPPPVPIMQIQSVMRAFEKHEGALDTFHAPVITEDMADREKQASADAAPVSGLTDAEQLRHAQEQAANVLAASQQEQRSSSQKKQPGGGGNDSSSSPTAQALTVKTSKYDVVKVRMWRGGHFHVLSRYLLARVLSESGLGRADAVRLALAAKKRLVDAGRLDVPEEECGALLRSMLREAGHAAAVPAFDMLREWGARRSPLLVLVCGTALAGKAALSTALAHHLNLAAMIQATNVYRVACSIEAEQTGLTGQQLAQRELPLYMHEWSSSEEMEQEYARRCAAVRRGLARDVDKALNEGRSVLIEGSLLDPTLFHDLLPLCAPIPIAPGDIANGNEIRKLISEVLKLSASDASSSTASPSVLFGALFEATQNSMEALSGTLMTAKRRGVVSYDGSLLLQRVHDNVRITLLKREIPDSPLPDHSKRKAPPLKPDAFATPQHIGNEKCNKCNKTVYQGERVGAAGKTYHSECFRCAHCNVILSTATFCNNKVANYCPSCYQMLVNKHGANF